MGVPNTKGKLQTSLDKMNIGDYIVCQYTATSGVAGTFSNLGTATGTEIPVASSATPNGVFYFVKVDKGLLIADRTIQINMHHDILNKAGFIYGKQMNLGEKSVLIRSLSGGCAFADSNGKLSLVDKGYGAFPIDNEWDKYINNSTLNGMITKSDDNVWHKTNAWSLVKEAPVVNTVFINKNGSPSTTSLASHRMTRGYNDTNWMDWRYATYNLASVVSGFRPVLEYLEINSKGKTLFY